MPAETGEPDNECPRKETGRPYNEFFFRQEEEINTLTSADQFMIHKKIVDDLCTTGELSSQHLEIKPILQGNFKHSVADAASKSYVIDTSGDVQGVLLVSNKINPDLIARSVVLAQKAADLLQPQLADVIITPLAEGIYGELSYVLWPVYRDFSSLRGLRFLQKLILMPRILNWLEQVTKTTRRMPEKEGYDKAFVIPLKSVAEDNRLSFQMRQAAEKGLERLRSGDWKPFNVLHHGDLWLGNILLPTRETRPLHSHGFVVIDWAGANVRGYPFYDLLRLSISSRLRRKRLYKEVSNHCRILSCEFCDVASYLLTAIGALGMNLEHFPEQRYISMAENVFYHLPQSVRSRL